MNARRRPDLARPGLALAASLLLTLFVTGGASGQAPGVSKLAGSWTWTWKGQDGLEHRHILEVEGVGKALAAREVFDDQPPVKAQSLTFDGTSVNFTVVRGDRKADYSGKLTDADTIEGTVTTTARGQSNEFIWKAERRKEAKKAPSSPPDRREGRGFPTRDGLR
jgi:hypothetical protein